MSSGHDIRSVSPSRDLVTSILPIVILVVLSAALAIFRAFSRNPLFSPEIDRNLLFLLISATVGLLVFNFSEGSTAQITGQLPGVPALAVRAGGAFAATVVLYLIMFFGLTSTRTLTVVGYNSSSDGHLSSLWNGENQPLQVIIQEQQVARSKRLDATGRADFPFIPLGEDLPINIGDQTIYIDRVFPSDCQVSEAGGPIVISRKCDLFNISLARRHLSLSDINIAMLFQREPQKLKDLLTSLANRTREQLEQLHIPSSYFRFIFSDSLKNSDLLDKEIAIEHSFSTAVPVCDIVLQVIEIFNNHYGSNIQAAASDQEMWLGLSGEKRPYENPICKT